MQQHCNGSCLQQSSCMGYLRKSTCPEKQECQPLKCPNFLFCGVVAPQWLFDCNHGLCAYCAIARHCGNGIPTMVLSEDPCPVCFLNDHPIRYTFGKKCSHAFCADCLFHVKYNKSRPIWPEPHVLIEDTADECTCECTCECTHKDDDDDDEDLCDQCYDSCPHWHQCKLCSTDPDNYFPLLNAVCPLCRAPFD
jgi:hypothetical protein